MNRIDQKFQALKATGRAAFMPYLTAGDPDLETTGQLILALEAAGADILELGIPFSDPVADGPTIQAASQRALAGGVTLEKVFELVRRTREKSQLPINLMSYYNPIYHYGLEMFVEKMVEVGADGLIIPDLSLEEAQPLKELTVSHEIKLISFIAPTSSAARQKRIAEQADGFIYLVSLTGVTGARKQVNDNLGGMITEIRSYTELPVCVGFGVATPEQAGEVARLADGVIVGSAIINRINEHLGQPDLVDKTAAFVKDIVRAVKNA